MGDIILQSNNGSAAIVLEGGGMAGPQGQPGEVLVSSVAGKTGAVVLSSSDITDLAEELSTKQDVVVPTEVQTASYAAAPGDLVLVDTTAASVPIQLPTAPPDLSRVFVKLIAVGAGHGAAIATGGSDVFNKPGGGITASLSLLNQLSGYQYSAELAIWYVIGDDLPLSQLDLRYPKPKTTWAASTSYTVNDLVQYQGASWRCLTSHTSNTNFQVDFIAVRWERWSARDQRYDVRDFGAKIDGGTDDTAAIQAAINACGAAGGGVVFVAAGKSLVSQLTLLNRVNFVGAGMWATTLFQIDGSNRHMIVNQSSSSANAMYVSIRDMKIDGHRHNTGGGSGNTSGDIIHFTTNPISSGQASGDDTFDTHNLFENLYLYHSAGWGFYQEGRGEGRLINCYADSGASGGFYPTFDTYLLGCSAGNNGGPGFYFTHGSILAVNCKSFISGYLFHGNSDGTDLNTNQPGFFANVVGDVTLNLVNCTAQNNNGPGFAITNSQNIIMQGCISDSNNFGPGNTLSQFAAVELTNASNCIIDVGTGQGFQNGSVQGNQGCILRITGTSDMNDIRAVSTYSGGFTPGPNITTDSVIRNNRIVINGVQVNPADTLAGLADVAITGTPADGSVISYSAATSKYVPTTAAAGTFAAGQLGDGSDGAVVFNGTNTYAAIATLSGGNYTLLKDVLATSITIGSGVTVFCSSYRFYATNTFTNNGSVNANGNAATSATGGGATLSTNLSGGQKGGNGVATGGAGTGNQGAFGVGKGGAGGNGSSTTGAAATSPKNIGNATMRNLNTINCGMAPASGVATLITGGCGGSGGGGDGTNAGGGGGSGGAMVLIIARSIINNGTLSANGANGFTPTTGNCGGGGGGGGGFIGTYSVNPWVNSGTATVNPGSGVAGSGTGTAGANGTAGTILNMVLS